MDGFKITILVLVIGLVLVVLRQALSGRKLPPLSWEDLSTFMDDESAVEKTEIARDNHPHGRNVELQFRSGAECVRYFRLIQGPFCRETIDVEREGSAGFSATFNEKILTYFSQVGGRFITRPLFEPNQEEILRQLIARIRRYANV